jgi:hypothetical protein
MSYPPPPYATPTGPPAPDAVPQGPPPSKGRAPKGLIVAVIFAALMLCCLGGVIAGTTGDKNEGAAVQPFADLPNLPVEGDSAEPVATTPAAKPKPKAIVLGDGTWEVAKTTSVEDGTLAPGQYKIYTPETGFNCYWARLRNFDGQIIGSVIANGNVGPGSTARVNVKASDAGLELKGDCEARR